MSYNVTLGPLPADGDLFDPRYTIPDYVNGTVVTGITADAFDTSELTFISAQTDPVAAPERSLFWFKRGEGQLYIWDSPQRSPSPGITGYSAVPVGIGPRVETILLISNELPKAQISYPGSTTDYYEDEDSLTKPYRITPRAQFSPGSTGTSDSQGYMVSFISGDTGESRAVGNGGMVPMVIRGFVDCNVHSGVTCLPGMRAVVQQRPDEGTPEDFLWMRASAHHSADSLCRLLGFIVGTLATADTGQVKVYKVGCPDTYRW
jgi:hypothetical protein